MDAEFSPITLDSLRPSFETDQADRDSDDVNKNIVLQHVFPGRGLGNRKNHRSAEDVRKTPPTWIPLTDIRPGRPKTATSSTSSGRDDATSVTSKTSGREVATPGHDVVDTSFCHDFSLNDLSLNSETISDNDFDTMGSLETMSGHHEPDDYLPAPPRGVLVSHHTLPKAKMKTYSSFSPVDRLRSSDKLIHAVDDEKAEDVRASRKKQNMLCHLLILLIATSFLMLATIYAAVFLQQNWGETDEIVQHEVNHFLFKFSVLLIAVITVNSWMIVKIFR